MNPTCHWYSTGESDNEPQEIVLSPEYRFANRPQWGSCVNERITEGNPIARCEFVVGSQKACRCYTPGATVKRFVALKAKGCAQKLNLEAIRIGEGIPAYSLSVTGEHGRVEVAVAPTEGEAEEKFSTLLDQARDADWTSDITPEERPVHLPPSYSGNVLGG